MKEKIYNYTEDSTYVGIYDSVAIERYLNARKVERRNRIIDHIVDNSDLPEEDTLPQELYPIIDNWDIEYTRTDNKWNTEYFLGKTLNYINK